MCAAARAPVVMIIRGSIFHPLAAMLSISGLYLLVLASSVSGENLSLQYVNSINCMVRFGSMFFNFFSLLQYFFSPHLLFLYSIFFSSTFFHDYFSPFKFFILLSISLIFLHTLFSVSFIFSFFILLLLFLFIMP